MACVAWCAALVVTEEPEGDSTVLARVVAPGAGSGIGKPNESPTRSFP
jgi:hypothetical protein